MNNSLLAILAFVVLVAPVCAGAETPSSESALRADGVPIERLVATVAKKTGKKFVLDPRVHAQVVLVGVDPAEITYPQFLTVLQVYGYAAVESGGYVQIIPDLMVRQEAIPTITAKDTRLPSEYVTQIIPVKNVSAPMLVPILRPLLPQQGHLAATAGNALLIADHFDNVRRIEALVRALDTAENKPRDAAPPKEEH